MTTLEARFAGSAGSFTLDAAFSVPFNGVSALFGPSGSGKTTIFNCIAGLIRPRDSSLVVDGTVWQDAGHFRPAHLRPVGYVFQGANLFPHLSVAANLRYGQKRRASRGHRGGALGFHEVTAMLGLERLTERMPQHLSGGEAQRVAIGRALLAEPQLLLLDEPLAGLDPASRTEIIAYLGQVRTRLAIPIILVTHDLAEVIRLADRLIRLEAGRVLGVEPLAEALLRLDLPFARAGDASSILAATVCDYDTRYGLARLAVDGGYFEVPMASQPVGKKLRLRIFATDVALSIEPPNGSSILNCLAARIADVELDDPYQVTTILKLGRGGDGAAIIARVTRKSWDGLSLSPGQSIWALVKAVSLVP